MHGTAQESLQKDRWVGYIYQGIGNLLWLCPPQCRDGQCGFLGDCIKVYGRRRPRHDPGPALFTSQGWVYDGLLWYVFREHCRSPKGQEKFNLNMDRNGEIPFACLQSIKERQDNSQEQAGGEQIPMNTPCMSTYKWRECPTAVDQFFTNVFRQHLAGRHGREQSSQHWDPSLHAGIGRWFLETAHSWLDVVARPGHLVPPRKVSCHMHTRVRIDLDLTTDSNVRS